MGKASRKKKKVCEISNFKKRDLEVPSILKTGLLQKSIFHIILIIVIGLLAYSNTFNVPFHFDDSAAIVENSELKDLSNFWPPSGSRWLGFITFALNYHFGGLNTIGYHIVNITIHIINAIFVYWLVILTFRTPYLMVQQAHNDATVTLSHEPVEWSKGSPFTYLPLFIALIFVSHPIQTQAVTYIVQRFTSLATFFYLLSLVMYIKFRSQQSAISRLGRLAEESGQQKLHATRYTLYAVSLVSAVLAMKTKEISFTLPVIIVLYEFMFFEGKFKKRILYLLPLLLTMLIIPLSMIGTDKPVGDAIGELREASQETDEIPRSSYLFTQFRVIVTYIRLLFLPINQNLDYDYPIYNSFLNPTVFLSFFPLFIIFGVAVYLFYTKRYTLHATRLISFGIFWFFITLSVESSVIPIKDVLFEHRLYLPSVGFITAFSATIFYFISRIMQHHTSRALLNAVYSLLAIIAIVLSIATYQRNIVWKDKITLWEDVVKKSPEKVRGYNNLGNAYRDKGWVDKAIEHYQIALSLKSDYVDAHNNLGVAYNDKGWVDRAIEHLQLVLRLKPDYAKAYNNIGNAYSNKGWLDKAIEHYKIALRLKPDYVEAHNNLAVAYASKGLTDKAIEHFQISLNLKPDCADVHFNLGKIYLEKGFVDKAHKEIETVLLIKPHDYEARQFLNYISNLNKTDSLGIH